MPIVGSKKYVDSCDSGGLGLWNNKVAMVRVLEREQREWEAFQ